MVLTQFRKDALLSRSLGNRQISDDLIGLLVLCGVRIQSNYGGLWKILLLLSKVNLRGQEWVTVEVGFLKVGFSQPA